MTRRGRAALALTSLVLFAACSRKERTKSPHTVVPPPAPPVEEADPPRRPPPSRAAAAPVIWIGLDGLDWHLLDRLAAAGLMPNWSLLVAEGHGATLQAFQPLLSPILWTSAATGADPMVHGVLDFQEVEPRTGRKLPISGRSRRVPAVWNAASAAGRRVGVVGWWATHPAEEVDGFFVSDRLAPLLYPDAPAAGLAYPAALSPGLAQLRAREGAVADSELAGFVRAPAAELTELRAQGGPAGPVSSLARIIGATRLSHRVARDLYDRERPDLMALYLAGTDEIGHVFAPYRPPRLPCVTDADAARYGGVVDRYYALVDRVLGQWMRRAEEDGATILVHSDHGFHWGEGRSCDLTARGWNTASFWHRPDGVFLAWGRRVRPSRARGTVRLLDVAPTVSALLGVAHDPSLRGRPLGAVFDGLRAAPPRPIFREVVVRRLADDPPSETEAAEYAKKLIALGYISGADTRAVAPEPGDAPGRTEGAWNNLGLYYRDTTRDGTRAREAFAKSLEVRPGYASPMFNLAVLARREGKPDRAEEWLFRSLAAGFPDPEGTLRRWAIGDLREERVERGERLLERAAEAYPDAEGLAQQLAFVRFQKKDCAGAAAALARFATASRQPDTLNSLALYRACLGRHGDAIELLQRSLAIRPDQPEARDSLERLRRGAASAP